MERKIFTYKDVEEAGVYVGKQGLFSDNLRDITEVPEGCAKGELVCVLLEAASSYVFKVRTAEFQFFSPDPAPGTPRYVPFTAADWELFLNKIVRIKNEKFIGAIDCVGRDGRVQIGRAMSETFVDLFAGYEFMDGSPCGKRVEE